MSGHTANQANPGCKKQRYDDKKSALTALNAALRRRHNRPEGLRAYACPSCGFWHLTRSRPAKVSATAATRAHVRAHLASPLAPLFVEGSALPDDIQWMPPGRHQITPFVEGEPLDIEVTVDAAMGEAVAREFASLRSQAASGRGDAPYLDFRHRDEEASAEVLDLYWGGEDPKKGGIRAKVKWSAAGRSALEGRLYRRFSPAWLMDEHTHGFLGLDTNLGGLVNKAAFQTIQPVVARRGDPNKPTPMTDAEKNELKNIVTEANKPLVDRITALETKAAAAPTTAAATVTASDAKLTDLEARVKAVEAASKTTTAAQAKAAVQVHAKRGAIPGQDADTVAFWEAQYQANPDQAEKMLAKIPDNPALAKLTQASAAAATTAVGETAEDFVKAVKACAVNGKTKGAAIQEMIAAHPKAYAAWREADGKPGI